MDWPCPVSAVPHVCRIHGVCRLSATYQPDSRRPIAQIFRKTAYACVDWCVKRGISPDLISYASIVSAALAGVCFWQSSHWPWLLIPAAGLCYLRLWCNMLDGMVALGAGKASKRGELINDLPDRISDILIFTGVAHSGWCHPLLAYWVMIAAMLVPYIGLYGQALGAKRQFGGVMSKPWRMVMLHVGAWVTLAMVWWGHGQGRYAGLSVLDWTHVLILAGCLQTIIFRLRRILGNLASQGTP